MGRLLFVGLGLWDADDMSVRARAALRSADAVLMEFYTSRLVGVEPQELAKSIGRPFEVLSRDEVETGRDRILDRAERETVAFVTAGDALTATTHQDLRMGALERGIDVDIIHGVSIKTAVPGLLGLSDYKFGRTTTLVFPEPRFFPSSPLEVILENRARGLHTLVLLDIRAEEGRYMTADVGAQVLLQLIGEKKEDPEAPARGLFHAETPVCVVAQAGSPHPMLEAGPLRVLAEGSFGPPLHCLVVPGRLSAEEADVAARVTGFPFNEGP